jgi:signal peptidase I
MRRRIWMSVTVVLMGLTVLFAWAAVTGRLSYVVTSGVSMLPIYHTGDLVVVAKKDSYGIGDIVAYQDGKVTVLHRVIDGDPGGWVTKGDSNESIDPARPTSDQLMGRASLHLAGGGTWLQRATSPPVLGGAAFLMVTGIGATAHRRRRQPAAVGRHVQRQARSTSVVAGVVASPTVAAVNSAARTRAVAGALLVVGIAGVALGALAWTRPVTETITAAPPPGRTMTFSYATTVPRTPAYDDTTVNSPEPVFRKVADELDVTYAYQGPPGAVSVAAVLSTAGGWRSTVQLAAKRSFAGNAYRGVVRLDLDALEARAKAGSAATGTPAGEINVAVVPRVTGETGAPFSPELALKLGPVALTPGDGPFVVQEAGPAKTKTVVPSVISVFGRDVIGVSTARAVAGVLLMLAALAGAGLALLARRSRAVTEGEEIRRRYRQLLVEVAPLSPPPDRPVVRMADFSMMARLAERYGLLVLHWSTSTSATFVVPDEAATYWYCTDPVTAVPQGAALAGTLEPAEPPRRKIVAGEPAGSVGEPAGSASAPAGSAAEAIVVASAGGATAPSAGARHRQVPAAELAEPPFHRQLEVPGARDGLTSLANLSLFEQEAQRAIHDRVGERPCLMLIGLAGVDILTDEHGAPVRDLVLITVAERLRAAVRPGDLVARLDGAVFAVLLEDVGTGDVGAIAKRMARTVNASIPVEGRHVVVRASLGVARAEASDGVASLMAHAVTALAEATAITEAQLTWFPSIEA